MTQVIEMKARSAQQLSKKRRRRPNTVNTWLIDRLYNIGTLDDKQYCAGYHIRFWWEVRMSQGLRCISLETVVRCGPLPAEALAIDKLTAFDMLMKISAAMHARGQDEGRALWAPCFWLAIDEVPMREIGKKLGMREERGRELTKEAMTILYKELEGRNLLFTQRDGG